MLIIMYFGDCCQLVLNDGKEGLQIDKKIMTLKGGLY